MFLKWLNNIISCSKISPNNIIVVGIDTHCYHLAQHLISESNIKIIAYIDDEPWSNRTTLLGSTVRYPSDLEALIIRNDVKLIIDFDGSTMIPESILAEISHLRCYHMRLNRDEAMEAWSSKIEGLLNA